MDAVVCHPEDPSGRRCSFPSWQVYWLLKTQDWSPFQWALRPRFLPLAGQPMSNPQWMQSYRSLVPMLQQGQLWRASAGLQLLVALARASVATAPQLNFSLGAILFPSLLCSRCSQVYPPLHVWHTDLQGPLPGTLACGNHCDDLRGYRASYL